MTLFWHGILTSSFRKTGKGPQTLVQNQHDFGVKSFLGQAGNFVDDDIVVIIMARPAAAEYVCGKLWSFFAYPDPEPEVVSRLAGIFRRNNSQIRPVVRAIFESEEFYSNRAVAALVKGPAELAAGTVRTLGIDTDFKRLDQPIGSMGQVLFDPPNVAGWPGGSAWLNSSSPLQRINLANATATARSGPLRFDPAGLLDGRVEAMRAS